MFDLPVPDGWKLVKLSDLGEVNRGRSRHRPRDAAHLYGGPYPFVQTGDVKASEGRVNKYTQTYSEDGLAQSRLWPKGTMCITIAANIAETGILQFPACFPDSVIGFIPDENKCNVYFIEYVFRLLKRRIQAQATGSVQDNINLQTLERLLFPIPKLEEQNRIADVLCTFDDKIELNRQTNQTLENIAQAIFKSWFVDFEPTRAKIAAKQAGQDPERAAMAAISGKSLEELDQLSVEQQEQLKTTAALFPDALVDSELGEIPEGWETKPLYETAEYVNGNAFKAKDFSIEGNGLPIVKIVELKNGLSEGTKYTTGEFKSKYSIKNDDILYSWSGSPETSLEVFKWFGGDAWLNQHIFKLNFESDEQKYFAYYLLKHMKPVLIATAQQKQTTGLGHITVADMKRLLVAYPDETLLCKFKEVISPLYDKCSIQDKEIIELANLRDVLLPKLLSGEVALEPINES